MSKTKKYMKRLLTCLLGVVLLVGSVGTATAFVNEEVVINVDSYDVGINYVIEKNDVIIAEGISYMNYVASCDYQTFLEPITSNSYITHPNAYVSATMRGNTATMNSPPVNTKRLLSTKTIN